MDQRTALLMALLGQPRTFGPDEFKTPGSPLEVPRAELPPEPEPNWQDQGPAARPPGYPRQGRFPPGFGGWAEEGEPVDDESSPSDQGTPGMPSMPPPPMGQPPGQPPEQPGMPPMRLPPVQMHQFPMQQAMMAQAQPRPDEADALSKLLEARKNPRFFGPGGMREEFSQQQTPTAPDEDFLAMRIAQLGKAPSMGGHSVNDTDRVRRGWMSGVREDLQPGGGINLVFGDGSTGQATDEQDAQAKKAAFANAKAQAWEGTMAGNRAKDQERHANLPTALNRANEHRLFRSSPKAWAMWKMMGGEQPGSPKMDAGGGYGGMAMMAGMEGNQQMAGLLAGLDRTQAETRHGQGQLDLAREESRSRAAGENAKLQTERRNQFNGLVNTRIAAGMTPELARASIARDFPEMADLATASSGQQGGPTAGLLQRIEKVKKTIPDFKTLREWVEAHNNDLEVFTPQELQTLFNGTDPHKPRDFIRSLLESGALAPRVPAAQPTYQRRVLKILKNAGVPEHALPTTDWQVIPNQRWRNTFLKFSPEAQQYFREQFGLEVPEVVNDEGQITDVQQAAPPAVMPKAMQRPGRPGGVF